MPPYLDPGLPAALAILVPLVAAVTVIVVLDRRRDRRRGRRGGGMHAMGRDDTVSYFRDYSDSSRAPGVREEDRTGRWGEPDDQSR